jgi:hypothetical protein
MVQRLAGRRPADNTEYDAILGDMASLHPFSSVQDIESYVNDGPGNANLASPLGLGSNAVPGSFEYADFMMYSLWMVSHHVAPYAAVAAAPAPASPAPAPSSAGLASDRALATSQGGQVREPSTIDLGGNRDELVTGIAWSNWASTSAQGVGSVTTNNCVPNCAQGSPITIQVSLTLSQPVNGVFTSLTTINSPTPNDPQGFSMTWTSVSVGSERLLAKGQLFPDPPMVAPGPAPLPEASPVPSANHGRYNWMEWRHRY